MVIHWWWELALQVTNTKEMKLQNLYVLISLEVNTSSATQLRCLQSLEFIKRNKKYQTSFIIINIL